jgi:hypothetical protein
MMYRTVTKIRSLVLLLEATSHYFQYTIITPPELLRIYHAAMEIQKIM